MPKVFQNDKLLITFSGEKLLIPEKECSFADIKLTSLHIIEMIQTVLKRDGRIVGYNEEKIKAAIRKAMLTTEMGEDEALIQHFQGYFRADRIRRAVCVRRAGVLLHQTG